MYRRGREYSWAGKGLTRSRECTSPSLCEGIRWDPTNMPGQARTTSGWHECQARCKSVPQLKMGGRMLVRPCEVTCEAMCCGAPVEGGGLPPFLVVGVWGWRLSPSGPAGSMCRTHRNSCDIALPKRPRMKMRRPCPRARGFFLVHPSARHLGVRAQLGTTAVRGDLFPCNCSIAGGLPVPGVEQSWPLHEEERCVHLGQKGRGRLRVCRVLCGTRCHVQGC